MEIIPKELTKKFSEKKYPMGTGSDEWLDIKTDFELEGDAVAGTVAFLDGSVVDKNKVDVLLQELQKFKHRVSEYAPKDDLEKHEKDILEEKIDIGLDIYKRILESLIALPKQVL